MFMDGKMMFFLQTANFCTLRIISYEIPDIQQSPSLKLL